MGGRSGKKAEKERVEKKFVATGLLEHVHRDDGKGEQVRA